MKKKKYIVPIIENIRINSKDIISTSNFGGEGPRWDPSSDDDYEIFY